MEIQDPPSAALLRLTDDHFGCSYKLIIHDSSTEWTSRAQRFPVVSLPSSIKHSWTSYLWSVHVQQIIFPSILFTVISMLHFVDQWIVSVSNMDLMFGSMISV